MKLVAFVTCLLARSAASAGDAGISLEGARRSWLRHLRETKPHRERKEQAAEEASTEEPLLSLMQVEAETLQKSLMGDAPLFSLVPDDEWQKHDMAKGATVTLVPGSQSLKVKPGLNVEDGVAWGHLHDNLGTTGWIELYLETTNSGKVSNDVRMYAAGLLEGLITATRMSQFYSNAYQLMMRDSMSGKIVQNIRDMFKDELTFVSKNANFHAGVASLPPGDPYWMHARYILLQMIGIKDGYNLMCLSKGVQQIDLVDMMMINSHAEMPELFEAYNPDMIQARRKFQAQVIQQQQGSFLQKNKEAPGADAEKAVSEMVQQSGAEVDHEAMKKAGIANETAWLADRAWEKKLSKTGHCSAFVRVADQNKDLFMGHTTWSDYSKMTRIFKYYHFDLPGSYQSSDVIGFSSYPGCVSSTDDFYMLSSGLMVVDTSLEILNPSVYLRVPDFPSNAKMPNFMHVMIVNRMSRTGAQWGALFSERNSGTNNAQWMVLDYNRFKPGEPVPDNMLWLIEQIPGMIHKADISGELRTQGYWASYDRPFFHETRVVSGHAAAEAQYGALFSFGASPRASIFKNIGVASETLFDMRSIMNRNVFPGEGVLPSEPGHAISARIDLDAVSHIPNGGIDAKVTNRCLFRSMQCQAISGPTHDSQPVFKWRDATGDIFPGWPHMGLPDVWDFNWVQMTPTAAFTNIVDQSEC